MESYCDERCSNSLPTGSKSHDGTFDAPGYIVCIDKLLKAFKRRFKDRSHEVHGVFHYQPVSR
jgi:hypothetical protein